MHDLNNNSTDSLVIEHFYVNRIGTGECTGIRGRVLKHAISSGTVQMVCALAKPGTEDRVSFTPLPDGSLHFQIPCATVNC